LHLHVIFVSLCVLFLFYYVAQLTDETVLSKISPELVLQSVRIELHHLVEDLPPRNYLLLRSVVLYLGNVLAFRAGILLSFFLLNMLCVIDLFG
jgi:hypothetical protein